MLRELCDAVIEEWVRDPHKAPERLAGMEPRSVTLAYAYRETITGEA